MDIRLIVRSALAVMLLASLPLRSSSQQNPSTGACPLNNTQQCAQRVQVGSSAEGIISELGVNLRERRYYEIPLGRDSIVALTLSPVPNRFGLTVTVYGSRQERLEQRRVYAGRPEVILLPSTRGTYSVEIAGRNNVGGQPFEREPFV